MKQTAVEWLYDQLTSTWFDKASGTDILKKAKEMEKKQTIEFAYNFYDNCFIKDEVIQKSAGEYYNETYGK